MTLTDLINSFNESLNMTRIILYDFNSNMKYFKTLLNSVDYSIVNNIYTISPKVGVSL